MQNEMKMLQNYSSKLSEREKERGREKKEGKESKRERKMKRSSEKEF